MNAEFVDDCGLGFFHGLTFVSIFLCLIKLSRSSKASTKECSSSSLVIGQGIPSTIIAGVGLYSPLHRAHLMLSSAIFLIVIPFNDHNDRSLCWCHDGFRDCFVLPSIRVGFPSDDG